MDEKDKMILALSAKVDQLMATLRNLLVITTSIVDLAKSKGMKVPEQIPQELARMAAYLDADG